MNQADKKLETIESAIKYMRKHTVQNLNDNLDIIAAQVKQLRQWMNSDSSQTKQQIDKSTAHWDLVEQFLTHKNKLVSLDSMSRQVIEYMGGAEYLESLLNAGATEQVKKKFLEIYAYEYCDRMTV